MPDDQPTSRTTSDTPALRGLTDSHCHLGAIAERGYDIPSLLASLRADGFGRLIDVAIAPAEGVAPYHQNEWVSTTTGLHPSLSGRDDWQAMIHLIAQQAETGMYVAIGETGLDWYRQYAPKERQKAVFRAHIDVAREYGLPLIVHNRNADRDCLEMLERASLPSGGVMHCFSSAAEWVPRFVAVGMHISFAGNVTFKSAAGLREACAHVPDDRLLAETDAPYLAPHPHRGADNQPSLIVHTYQVIAETRGQPLATIASTCARNLNNLFETNRSS